MSTSHQVQQGEYLASIAALYGVSQGAIWNDPANSELKKKRANPNVLFPGDTLTIPDKQTETFDTGMRHRFRLTPQTLVLRFVVRDSSGKPLANTDCILRLDGKDFKLKTDGNGKIEQDISSSAKEGSLEIKGIIIPIKIGHLDPVEEKSGQIARLNNLSYDAGDINNINEGQFLSALEEFQCDYKLTVDGICGKNTQAKLQEVHGS